MSIPGVFIYKVSRHLNAARLARSLAYLCLRQAQAVGQLLPLGSNNIVVLLEGSFQTQQLRRGEGRSDALGLPGEGAVEQQAVLGHVVTWRRREKTGPQCQVNTCCVPIAKQQKQTTKASRSSD